MSKQKIYNDPVYGFVTVPYNILNLLIDHPYFQRLRRIKQLGLTHYVYPGALHTRFHHAIGALHLMHSTLESLRAKGVKITHEEAESTCIAILLHDIGHGPFSHALERSIVNNVHHETISLRTMQALNNIMSGKLTTAIEIFEDKYPKKFLHQLVSSQLDMDRMDYLNRDSFFTGVSEGVISSDRIIKMLDVHRDTLVVEEKGIYSIEKFIIARRLMYWQVYLHKTVLAAEHLLMNILRRAKEITQKGITLFATPSLQFFLQNNITDDDFINNPEVLQYFTQLDDYDIFASIKVWASDTDFVLSRLCTNIINRNLYKIRLQKVPVDQSEKDAYIAKVQKLYKVSQAEIHYFVFTGTEENSAYQAHDEQILILYKNGTLLDIANASDNLNISVLSKPIIKHFLCVEREILARG